MKLKIQGLPEPDSEDLEVTVRFKHGDAVSIGLSHRLKEHGGLSGTLLANDEIVVPTGFSLHDPVEFLLLIADNPVLVVMVMMLSIFHTCNLECRITRTESVVHLLQD